MSRLKHLVCLLLHFELLVKRGVVVCAVFELAGCEQKGLVLSVSSAFSALSPIIKSKEIRS